MSRYLVSRLIDAIPVIVGVSVLVFLMLHLVPGDPVMAMFMNSGGVTTEQLEQVRHLLGLDQPLPTQYWNYVSRALRGDLGQSILGRQPVIDLILQNLPSTLQLTVAGLGIAIVIGMSLGILAALHHNSWLDNLTMVVATLGVSIPGFWLGLLLIYVFGVTLRWVSITSGTDFQRLALPAIALGFDGSALIARLTRSCLLEVLGEDYIRTARAKGLPNGIVILRHAMRNSLIPVVTVIGLQLGNLMGGAVIIEVVFARQGIGQLLVGALLARDFPVAQGCVLLVALIYVLVNLGVDSVYAIIDPRIRYE